ncbi:hypothetical protein PYV02_04035 [Leifsonia sp. H3M29-4]|nr:hypothetical protein [Salinibacterium metalliresistens]MDF1478245.1 hypothetical protein [Salinibacterium metalliresistens]
MATTSSGVRIAAPAVASSVPTTVLNSVLVAPGESAKTKTPMPRDSAHSDSVKLSTNAFAAP